MWHVVCVGGGQGGVRTFTVCLPEANSTRGLGPDGAGSRMARGGKAGVVLYGV